MNQVVDFRCRRHLETSFADACGPLACGLLGYCCHVRAGAPQAWLGLVGIGGRGLNEQKPPLLPHVDEELAAAAPAFSPLGSRAT